MIQYLWGSLEAYRQSVTALAKNTKNGSTILAVLHNYKKLQVTFCLKKNWASVCQRTTPIYNSSRHSLMNNLVTTLECDLPIRNWAVTTSFCVGRKQESTWHLLCSKEGTPGRCMGAQVKWPKVSRSKVKMPSLRKSDQTSTIQSSILSIHWKCW